MKTSHDRADFNTATAPKLAAAVGVTTQERVKLSTRFAYFADKERFVVIAGAQEGSHIDLAFAHGLTHCEDRRLVLVLPEQHAFATTQRAPWFNAKARPEIWLHNGKTARQLSLPSKEDTVEQLAKRLMPGQTLEADLRKAATPTHLGAGTAAVHDLVEWATKHPLLDGSHRCGERAWHCMGQKVLSMKEISTGLVITAGIHSKAPPPFKITVTKQTPLEAGQLETIRQKVVSGAEARLGGSPLIHKPDEHWLQATIRREPSLVGVEHPALRELPAWRPKGSGNNPAKAWGRGFIDLIGVDGHGDIRVVETKVADNEDDLFIFQGLDYYIWAKAYRDVLLRRLGAPKEAEFEIHYVIGDPTDDAIHVSRFAAAQACGLDDAIRWRFQIIRDWYRGPTDVGRATSKLLPRGELPGTAATKQEPIRCLLNSDLGSRSAW